MRTFHIIRNADESNISGTGKVLEGVVFDDGTTVIRWCVKGKPNSTAMYSDFAAFKLIHIDSHPTNETEIVWHETTGLALVMAQMQKELGIVKAERDLIAMYLRELIADVKADYGDRWDDSKYGKDIADYERYLNKIYVEGHPTAILTYSRLLPEIVLIHKERDEAVCKLEGVAADAYDVCSIRKWLKEKRTMRNRIKGIENVIINRCDRCNEPFVPNLSKWYCDDCKKMLIEDEEDTEKGDGPDKP